MEYTVAYDEDKSFFNIILSGPINKESIIASIVDYTSHPQWMPDIKVLLDYRNTTLREHSPDEVVEMAKATHDLADKFGPIHMAVLMSDHHDYGMARYWQIQTPKAELPYVAKIFKKYDQAIEWLEI